MATPQKPVLFIVPGSTQTPSHYSHLLTLLHEAGYPTLSAILPSIGALKPVSLRDDADFVRDRMLRPLIEMEDRDVVMIMHSYSGAPRSEAAKGLGKADRMARGKSSGVIGQIFIAALLVREGEDVMGLLGGTLPPHIHRRQKAIKSRVKLPETNTMRIAAVSPLPSSTPIPSFS